MATTHRDQRHDEQAPATSTNRVRRVRTPTASRDQTRIRTVGLVVAVMLAAIVAVIILTAPPTPVDVPAAGPRSDLGTTAVDEDEALRRLIASGYVPAVTAETNPSPTVPDGLYTDEQAATLRRVRAGLLPAELLDAEPFVTNRLINRGLIPAGSAR
jgi:hypothetical protein